jgi:hypothetical protein
MTPNRFHTITSKNDAVFLQGNPQLIKAVGVPGWRSDGRRWQLFGPLRNGIVHQVHTVYQVHGLFLWLAQFFPLTDGF